MNNSLTLFANRLWCRNVWSFLYNPCLYAISWIVWTRIHLFFDTYEVVRFLNLSTKEALYSVISYRAMDIPILHEARHGLWAICIKILLTFNVQVLSKSFQFLIRWLQWVLNDWFLDIISKVSYEAHSIIDVNNHWLVIIWSPMSTKYCAIGSLLLSCHLIFFS